MPRFLLWMLFGWPLLFTQCVDLDVHLYYVTVQNLVCGCENVSLTTTESSDTPPVHCAQHVQQSVDMSMQVPADQQCDLVQMAEVVQQNMYLSEGYGCTLEKMLFVI